MITEAALIEALTVTEAIIRARFSRKVSLVSQRVSIEDVLQSVALKALKARAKCGAESIEELNHWVLTIAKNTVESLVTHHRSCGKRAATKEGCAIGVATEESRDGFQPADLESDPSVKAEIAEEVNAVFAVLDQLTPDRARAIRMRYLEQMELDDIAAEMGITNNAVRALVSKGLARVRQLVAC